MKILDLELYCNNLETIQRFYVRRLGLPMLSHSSAHLTVLVGHTRLTFRKIETVVAPYHMAINVPRGSLDVLMYYYDLDFLATQSPQQTIAYFPNWRAKACYFYDPAGNLLEFIARTDLNLDDPNLTLGDMFQGISEVGLATEDVPYTAEQLQRRFNVTQFSRTTSQPDFNALGDDNGLFILAKVGRPWLFTNTPAGLNYFRIQFMNRIDEEVQELYSYEVNRLPIGKPGSALSQLVPSQMTDFAY